MVICPSRVLGISSLPAKHTDMGQKGKEEEQKSPYAFTGMFTHRYTRIVLPRMPSQAVWIIQTNPFPIDLGIKGGLLLKATVLEIQLSNPPVIHEWIS